MIELGTNTDTTQMIDFGRDGKVLFQLPVLGQKGVPMGIMSAFAIFWDKIQSGRKMTEHETASAWSFFIQVLADSYPDATRQIAGLDEDNLRLAMTEWLRQSAEVTGFNPKAA